MTRVDYCVVMSVTTSEHHQHHPARSNPLARFLPANLAQVGLLLFCVSGIYLFFLTWGVMQERLTSTMYRSVESSLPAGRFRAFLLLNTLQSLVAAGAAWSSLRAHGLHIELPSGTLLSGYLKVAAAGCTASPLGYAALKHISYPTLILGKSCKLLPLVLINVLVHRRRFEPYKYVTVLLITAGVAGFLFFEGSSNGAKGTAHGSASSLYGLVLLGLNLLLDGATNAWQDELFVRHRVRAQHMMLYMNLISAGYLILYQLMTNPFTGQLSSGLDFVRTHPSVLRDMLLFCTCGALGQLFIFLTIEHFGSVVLVTVTVTRKLFTILLSLFWFEHRLGIAQWASVSLVFIALGIESFFKPSGGHHHHNGKKIV